jgi:hypothetical protein
MDADSLGELIAEAAQFTLDNDRRKYQPYFEAAERFCSERGIIIGGKAGVDLLLGNPLTKDSFIWDLYCANTFENAKALVELLYNTKNNHVDNQTISLQTNIKHREFTISIEARFLFKVYILDKYRDVVLEDIMEPSLVRGWFGSQVKVFSPSIVLIGLYQTLYSPSKCKQWQESYDIESKIYSHTIEKIGGFDRSVSDDILLRTLIKDTRVVLIGDFAAAKLGVGTGSRLQILTAIPLEELSAMTSRVLSNEKNQLRRVKVTHERTIYVKYNLCLPSDFQITKHTMYAVVNGEQVPLYDVFNSPTYELVPYTTVDKIQIGAPYVLLRFIFIDIWIVKLIIGLGKRGSGEGASEDDSDHKGSDSLRSDITGSADANLSSRISKLMNIASAIREYIEVKMQSDPYQVFTRDYIGINTSEVVAKKKLIANIGYRLPNYYPAVNKSGE